jgi:hypothetical protein
MRTTPLSALLVAILSCSLFAASAQAQRDRVFVASYGSDSNPCTYGSPCKTFQQALSVVAVAGEVTAIDSAGFGPVIITQSVAITSPNGVEAGIAAAAGGNAITINGASAIVSLRGLTLEGSDSGSIGVYMEAGERLDIDNCVIRDYTYSGIYISTADVNQVTITNTHILNNSYGVYLTTPSNGSLYTTLDNVVVTGNDTGLYEGPGEVAAFVTITNSGFSHNGVAIFTGGFPAGVTANANLYNVVFNDNNDVIYLNNYSTVALSHVYDMHSASGLVFTGNISVVVDSDDTNHVALSGPNAPGSLGSYPFK